MRFSQYEPHRLQMRMSASDNWGTGERGIGVVGEVVDWRRRATSMGVGLRKVHVPLCICRERLEPSLKSREAVGSLLAGLGSRIGEHAALRRVIVGLRSSADDIGIVYRGWDRYGSRSTSINMAEGERQRLKGIRSELVIIMQDRVMGRSASTQETAVALQIEVEFDRMSDFSIDDEAGRCVA